MAPVLPLLQGRPDPDPPVEQLEGALVLLAVQQHRLGLSEHTFRVVSEHLRGAREVLQSDAVPVWAFRQATVRVHVSPLQSGARAWCRVS